MIRGAQRDVSRLVLLAGWALLAAYPAGSRAADAAATPVDFNRDVRPILADKCFACHGPDESHREAELRLDVRDEALADRGGYQVVVPGKPDESELIERITSEDDDLRMPPGSTGKSLSDRDVEVLRAWIAEGGNYQTHWAWIAPQKPPVPAVSLADWPRNPIDHFVLAELDEQGLSPAPDADRRTLIRRLYFDLLGLPPAPEEVASFLADTSDDAYQRLVERLLASEHFGERMATYWLDVVRYADSGGYHSDNERSVWPFRDYVIRAFNENYPFDRFTVEQLAGDLLPDATTEQKVASGFNRLLQTTEEGGAQPKEYTAKYLADRVRNTAGAWLGVTMGCCECHNHKFDPFTIKDFYSFGAFFADVEEKAVGRQDPIALPSPEQAQQLADLEKQLAPLREELAQNTPALEEARAKWEQSLRERLDNGEAKKQLQKELTTAVVKDLQTPAEQRTAEQQAALDSRFRGEAPELADVRAKIRSVEQRIEELRQAIPQTLISVSIAPRTVRVLPRGNWLDDSGEIVGPATPAALPDVQIGDRQRARLDLARWMVAPENPLVARVFVNRLWKLFFSEGIVRSLGDFGTQGQWPTHPELLDWLAVELRDGGWDVKRLVKLIVMSRTYQQASSASDELRRRDPNNHLLARQTPFRLDAEFVRDSALAISGLLSDKIGGPSVKPYQPAGYWRYLNFPTREWQQDQGDDLYRRGLYTHWQRTFPHPSLVAFDAPSREECTAERPRSNTPLQALALLNDPTYVEAARGLAVRVIRDCGDSVSGRVRRAFQHAVNRDPTEAEIAVLSSLYEKHRQQYEQSKDEALKLLAVGESPLPEAIDPAELAAWTSVSRVILNQHEVITRY